MKIAHVITRLIVGGAQENTVLTCAGLVERGHDVTLIAGPETGPEGSLWPQAEASGAQLVRLDTMRRAIAPWRDWRCGRDLTAIFRSGRFDVVHTHSSKAGIVGRWAAHRAGVPTVVHTIHGMSFNRTQRLLVRRLYAALERRAAPWTDVFVSVADAMTNQAVAAGIAPRAKFVTVRSGMATDSYGPNVDTRKTVREGWNCPDDAVVVATIARLFRNKGYESLLEALPAVAAACPQVRFVWIGDGRDRRAYMQTLESLRLRDRVHFTGLVPPTEIPRLLNGCDALVHASQWEGLPRALVQAALTEVPAVSFDNDGAPEVVEDGVTGRLVPLGNTHALADGIIELCSDSSLRRRLGQAARQACLDRFDWRVMVDALDQLYRKLAH